MGADPTGNIWPKAEWRLPGNGHNEADSGAWEVDRSFRTESDAADQFRYRTLTIEDKASRDRQISPQPERPACELRRSTPRRHARRDSSDGGHGEFPGQSSDEQVAADALVSASADLVLQVRCAVYNGTLGSGFGQRFEPIGRRDAPVGIAA